MVRVLIFLAFLAALAAGAAWFADRPGEVSIVWQGYQFDTSVAVAVVAVIGLAFAVMGLWTLLRFVLRLPDLVSLASRARRRTKGFAAVSRGMIAIGAGDPTSARRHAGDAERLLGTEPLTLLLKAQAAQITGDRAGAEAAFNRMLDEPETRVLGLRGLFVEARRKGDAVAARAYAAKAAQLAPTVGWANEAVLEYHCADRDWRGALAALERRAASRHVDKGAARRQRAVLLTADALDRAEREPDAALSEAREAVKLAPDLVSATTLAGRLLGRQGQIRKASKLLEAGWRMAPHPDIAAAYLGLRPGDSTRDRLARAELLMRIRSGADESHLTLAEAALAAREFGRARETLRPLVASQPGVRACLLMAEIEEAEHGNTRAVRGWLARASRAPRDPAWMADGVACDRWAPVSPTTGRLDAFVWAAPASMLSAPIRPDGDDDILADGNEAFLPEAVAPRQIDHVEPPMPAESVAVPAAPEREAEPPPVEPATEPAPALNGGASPRADTTTTDTLKADEPAPTPEPDRAAEPSTPAVSAGAPSGAAAASRHRMSGLPLATPVIFPVPHAPDDPGPDALARQSTRSGLFA